MLADRRALSLIDNFAEQWLRLRGLSAFEPDRRAYPTFDDTLATAFEQETRLFLGSVMRENRSILDVLDADYTFLNQRLAENYGIAGVTGPGFRRVSLAGNPERGGLLGQGSVLMATSHSGGTDPTCASCHDRIDPLGFALENFDVIGRWRGDDEGGAIDPSGSLPNGKRINGFEGLKQHLVSEPEPFVDATVARLMTYALGRELDVQDEALEIAQRLLDGGADPNRQTLYPTPGPAGEVRINPASPGSSAFHVAANSGSEALVKLLAERGADPNLLRNDGHTPFSTAVVSGSLPVIQAMVASGADLSMRYDPDDKIPDPYEAITLSRQQQTILHLAAAATHGPEVMGFLYKAGAAIDMENKQGETPLDLADHVERFQESLAKQNAAGNPERLKEVKRPTETTDAIRELLAERAKTASSASPTAVAAR